VTSVQVAVLEFITQDSGEWYDFFFNVYVDWNMSMKI
jgi:hypothetical protein